MADIYFFLKMGIKSYIEQSFSQYSKNTKIILNKNFDNNFLYPLFINDMSLYKDLIQKNKLKVGTWRIIGNLLDQKINQILREYKKIIEENKKKVLKYTEKYNKSEKEIKLYEDLVAETRNKIINFHNSDNDKIKKNKKVKAKEELIDEKNYNNDIFIHKFLQLTKKLNLENENIRLFISKLKKKKKFSEIGEINLLKLEIMKISLYILINEISELELLNTDYNKQNSYKLLNDYIIDFIDKSEKIKDITNSGHYTFIRVYVIEEALIINLQGYKDLNKSFLHQILNSINVMQLKYSNSHISNLIKSIQELISNPEKVLCPNAFQILKEASYKNIKSRSRDNSFDKYDLENKEINSIDIKNERNRKIDEFFKLKKDEKSDNDDEVSRQKELSNIINLKNSSINNNNNNNLNSYIHQNQNNYNIKSQKKSNFGPIESNKYKSYQNNSTKIPNSSKVNLKELYRSDSFSEKLGINSRLVSQLPSLIKTKQEKNKNNIEFKEKIHMKRKSNNEKSDKIIMEEFRKIVNNNFYSNENEKIKEKNNIIIEIKNNKNSNRKIDSNKTKRNIFLNKTIFKTESENKKDK